MATLWSSRARVLAAVFIVLLFAASSTAIRASGPPRSLLPPNLLTTASESTMPSARVQELEASADSEPTIPLSLQPRVQSAGLPPAPSGPATAMTTSVDAGSNPYFVVYDSGNGYVYVTNSYSANVSVINGTKVVGTVNVGTYPFYATYDSMNGYVYVANSASGNVSVINGTKVIGTVTVGSYPYLEAFDSRNGFVYVSNDGSNSVSVINGTKVTATITVGSYPYFSAYDSWNGYVYVSNYDSKSVSVINGTKVIATVAVGTDPYLATDDIGNGDVYVANSGSSNVSVINGTKVVGTASVGTNPEYGAYDGENGYVYVLNYGSNSVSVINGTKVVGTVNVGNNPYFAIYDSGDSHVYVTNEFSNNVSVINGTKVVGAVNVGNYPYFATCDVANGYVYVADYGSGNVSVVEVAYELTFREEGLPNGTEWSVNISGGPSVVSNSSTLSESEYYGTYSYSIFSADRTYAAHGGTFTFNSTSTQETIVFSRVKYPVSFSESGLPIGTDWSVTLGGLSLSSQNSSIGFSEPNATYDYHFGTVPGWTTFSFNGSVVVNGRSLPPVAVAWSQVTYSVTVGEEGLPAGTGWWVNLTGGPPTYSLSSALALSEPNGTYRFVVSTTNQSYAAPGGTFSVDAGPVSENVSFSLVTFGITFVESGLAAGSNWSVNLGGVMIDSTTTTVGFTEPNGTYLFAVTSPSRVSSTPSSGVVEVNGSSQTQAISFTTLPPAEYSVTFTETGLPINTRWSVVFNATSASALGSIVFSGVENGSYSFKVAEVAGYSSTPASGSVDVSGANVAKSITFTLVASPSATFLGLPASEGIALLGAILVLVVLAVAIVALRSRKGRSRPPAAQPGAKPPSGRARAPARKTRPPGGSPPS
jgi:YVTN family beta-propeller protein